MAYKLSGLRVGGSPVLTPCNSQVCGFCSCCFDRIIYISFHSWARLHIASSAGSIIIFPTDLCQVLGPLHLAADARVNFTSGFSRVSDLRKNLSTLSLDPRCPRVFSQRVYGVQDDRNNPDSGILPNLRTMMNLANVG